jgi:hypothetical protein
LPSSLELESLSSSDSLLPEEDSYPSSSEDEEETAGFVGLFLFPAFYGG